MDKFLQGKDSKGLENRGRDGGKQRRRGKRPSWSPSPSCDLKCGMLFVTCHYYCVTVHVKFSATVHRSAVIFLYFHLFPSPFPSIFAAFPISLP